MLLGLHFARLGRLFNTLGSKVWPGREQICFLMYFDKISQDSASFSASASASSSSSPSSSASLTPHLSNERHQYESVMYNDAEDVHESLGERSIGCARGEIPKVEEPKATKMEPKGPK